MQSGRKTGGTSMNETTKPRYKWDSPFEWLKEKADCWPAETLYKSLMDLAVQVDSDTIQDLFQTMMEEDGYFRDLDNPDAMSPIPKVFFCSDQCRDEYEPDPPMTVKEKGSEAAPEDASCENC